MLPAGAGNFRMEIAREFSGAVGEYAPAELHDLLVQHERGRGHNDLVAGVQDAKERRKQRLRRAGRDDDFRFVIVHAVFLALKLRDGLAQPHRAVIFNIVRLVVVERLARRINNRQRRVKIRLAQRETHAAGRLLCQPRKFADGAALRAVERLVEQAHRLASGANASSISSVAK